MCSTYNAFTLSNSSDSMVPEDVAIGVTLNLLEMEMWIQTLCYVIIGCGILGNLLVIIITMSDVSMRYSTNYLVSNLSVADSLVLLTHLPLPIVRSEWWCKIVHYLLYVACNASIGGLVTLAGDRYMAVVHHSWSKPYRNTKNTILCIIIMWIFTCSHCIAEYRIFGLKC